MTEDRELDALMENEPTEDEKAAEFMSEHSFELAINEYRSYAKSPFFEEAVGGEIPMSWGEKLADRIVTDERKLRYGVVRLEFFSSEEWQIAYDALRLPFYIHYKEYSYVGSGGNSDGFGDKNEADKFNEEEKWESCDETDMRDSFVSALRGYCISAAAIARKVEGAQREQRRFMRAFALIEANCCKDHENELGGMTPKQAEQVVRIIFDATQMLWAAIRVDVRLGDWERELTGQSRHGFGSKRYEELVAKCFDQTASEDEIEELRQIGSGHPEAMMMDEIGDADDEDDGEQSDEVEDSGPAETTICRPDCPMMKLDVKARTVEIHTRRNSIKKFVVPEEYDKAWMIVKWLFQNADDHGFFEFRGTSEYYRDKWLQQFRHSIKPNKDMYELSRYIHASKGPGKRGATRIRLEDHPKAHGVSRGAKNTRSRKKNLASQKIANT